MKCINCGNENPDQFKYCATCGAQLLVYPAAPPQDPHGDSDEMPERAHSSGKLILLGIAAAGMVGVICMACVALVLALNWLSGNNQASVVPPRQAPSNGTAPPPAATLVSNKQWKALQVVQAFQKEGLEASNSRAFTKEDYGLVPQVATEAIRFLIPSLGGSKGGRVYTFANKADLDKVRKHYEDDKSAANSPWVFTRDNILLHINGELPERKALGYKEILDKLK